MSKRTGSKSTMEEEINTFILNTLRFVNGVLLRSTGETPDPNPICPKTSEKTSAFLVEVFDENFKRAGVTLADLLPPKQLRTSKNTKPRKRNSVSSDCSSSSSTTESTTSSIVDLYYEELLQKGPRIDCGSSSSSSSSLNIIDDENDNDLKLDYSAFFVNTLFGKLPISEETKETQDLVSFKF